MLPPKREAPEGALDVGAPKSEAPDVALLAPKSEEPLGCGGLLGLPKRELMLASCNAVDVVVEMVSRRRRLNRCRWKDSHGFLSVIATDTRNMQECTPPSYCRNQKVNLTCETQTSRARDAPSEEAQAPTNRQSAHSVFQLRPPSSTSHMLDCRRPLPASIESAIPPT